MQRFRDHIAAFSHYISKMAGKPVAEQLALENLRQRWFLGLSTQF
jgi:hypothetical protein